MLQFPVLVQDCNIFHFVTTRHGGVSQGSYASMNPGEYGGDDAENVQQNRALLCNIIGISTDRLITPFQVHDCEVRTIGADFLSSEEQKSFLHGVDAVITSVSGICIGISTADCVPILLWEPQREVVAAVHAGWRGTVGRIVCKTIEKMVAHYGCDPTHICAGIGPSISQEAFEVGEEVVGAFHEQGHPVDKICIRHPQSGKAHIDLWESNKLQLIESGVSPEHIEVAGICTYTHHHDLFSARRLGIRSGRLLSAIMIKQKNNISL